MGLDGLLGVEKKKTWLFFFCHKKGSEAIASVKAIVIPLPLFFRIECFSCLYSQKCWMICVNLKLIFDI